MRVRVWKEGGRRRAQGAVCDGAHWARSGWDLGDQGVGMWKLTDGLQGIDIRLMLGVIRPRGPLDALLGLLHILGGHLSGRLVHDLGQGGGKRGGVSHLGSGQGTGAISTVSYLNGLSHLEQVAYTTSPVCHEK